MLKEIFDDLRQIADSPANIAKLKKLLNVLGMMAKLRKHQNITYFYGNLMEQLENENREGKLQHVFGHQLLTLFKCINCEKIPSS